MIREFSITPRPFESYLDKKEEPMHGEEGQQDDSLDELSLEDLEAMAHERGIDTSTSIPGVGADAQDPLDSKSLAELEAMVEELENPTAPPEPKQKIEALPTQLEFTSPEITDGRTVNLETQVSGKPRGLQVLEQLVEPYKRYGLARNLLTAATDTDEEKAAKKESTFQTELTTETEVFDISARIREIEQNAGERDLNDDELDELFALQEKRNQIETKARVKFNEEGSILEDPDITVAQMASVVAEDPMEFGRIMANEMMRNPYMVVVPAGYARAANTMRTTASALTRSRNIIRGAEITGGTLSVAGLAATDAAAVDMAEQAAGRGTIDTDQTIEQAKIGAVIGAVIGAGMGAAKTGKAIYDERQLAAKAFHIEGDPQPKHFEPVYDADKTHMVIDNKGDILEVEKLDPIEAAINRTLDEEFLPKAVEQLVEEQNARFDAKLTPERRKQIGQGLDELYQKMYTTNERIIKMQDRQSELLQADQSDTKISRDVRATSGNVKALHETYDEIVALIKTYEDILIQDRDLSLEILRSQELNGKLKSTDIEARVNKLLEEEGLERPTTKQATEQFNANDEVGEAGITNPKVLQGVLGDGTKSFKAMGVKLEPPHIEPAPKGLFKSADTTWNLLVDVTYGKAVGRLDNLSEVSPTAKKLRNIMAHDGEVIQKVPAHTNRILLKMGDFNTQLKDAMLPLRSDVLGFLDKGEAAAVVRILRGEGAVDQATSPTVQKAAKNIRKMLNDFVSYAREAGHEVGFQGDYFPRVYDKKILGDPAQAEAFKQVLIKHGVPQETANETVEKILLDGGVIDFQVATMHADMAMPDVQPLNKRTFDFIPDEELSPFLVNNLYDTLNDYIGNGVRAVEFTRSFGPGGRKFLEMTKDIVDEVANAGGRLEKVEYERMFDLVNALHGNYGRFTSKKAQASMSGANVYSQLATLPLVTLSSLVEPFIGLSRVRPDSWVKGFAKASKAQANRGIRVVFPKLPADQLARETEELGIAMDAAITEHLGSLFGGEINNKQVNKVSSLFFRANLLQQWTSFVRTGAFESGKIDIVKNLKALTKPDISDQRRGAIETDIKKLGMDVEEGKAWIERGATVEDPYYKDIQEAALVYTNGVMVHPDATNRPMFFSSPKASILNSLLSYPIVFSNTVMKEWYNGFFNTNAYYKTQHGMKVAGAVTSMYMVADIATAWREQIQWGEDGNPNLRNETEGDRALRVLTRAGLMGPTELVANAYTGVKYGSDAVSSRMGPTVSMVNKYFQGIANLSDDDGDTLKKAFVRTTPFININSNFEDWMYRDVMRGGEIFRPTEFKPTEYDIVPPAQQAPRYFWNNAAEPMPPLPDELIERTKKIPKQEALKDKDVTRVIKIDPETGEIEW